MIPVTRPSEDEGTEEEIAACRKQISQLFIISFNALITYIGIK
jgi:hypothetical protein